MTETPICEPTCDILKAHPRWKRNRDIIEGEYAVKHCGVFYLPMPTSSMSALDYAAFKDRTLFYPAASRTHDGLMGLMYRKAPVLTAGALLASIASMITQAGDTVEDLCEEVSAETLITNFTGLLTDQPTSDGEMSRADALALGYRPFIAVYRAESILEVTQSVVRNRKVLTRVRLLDDCATVRELLLIDGQYVQRVWKEIAGTWNLSDEFRPTRDGAILDHIPFVVVNSDGKLTPTPAALDHCVNLNLQHYRQYGLVTIAMMYQASPIGYVAGLDLASTIADDGTVTPAPTLSVSPGTIWQFADATTKVGTLEFSEGGIGALSTVADKIEEFIATVGARILSSDKAAAEAAETLAIRRASENSVLASTTRTIGRQIEVALQMVADWMGDTEEVKLALNTDFLPSPMTSLELQAIVQAWQAGAISTETKFYALQQGEIVPPTTTFEEEQARIDSEAIDRPTTTTTPAL
jgi:hypothetical protein